MDKVYDDKKECCGCTACLNICPVGAISMVTDTEGFVYPHINEDICINCGLCRKVCPFINYDNNKSESKFIGAINKDDNIRQKSSSGGVFFALCEYVISCGGVVFGCEMNNGRAEHSFTDNLESCKKYLGSKYVQSYMGDKFRKVKDFLENDKSVLFSGTPCQVNGLKKYLGKDYDNLFCIDVICHGAPSPKVLDKYLNEIELIANSKVKSITFRDKRKGWKAFVVVVVESGEEFTSDFNKDLYLRLFLSNIDLRPSCHNCKANGELRKSDISLADFWGVSKKYPELNDNKGTSLILLNTYKGEELFNKINNNLIWKEVDSEFAIQNNPCIVSSVNAHENRKEFFENLDDKTLKELSNKYCKQKLTLRKLIGKILRKLKLVK